MSTQTTNRMSAFLVEMVRQAIHLAADEQQVQRLCIGLIQARANECRDLAGLISDGATTVNPGDPAPVVARKRMALQISMKLRERSQQLEQMGVKLATCWPPMGEDFPDEAGVEL